ncbi:hypothetical protein LG651_14725 [Tamlana sp. 62-3]|uniref:Uncharacterized protein n=1 Tax=Neotamlana sargassicola TaxID=2883125 RepID=A0A9X1L939_9FLAO|nr:hypothetical protein [Tamlana sargassicola]MCB4809508.1 hypothetical protein [Tamlana sargassicola]
MKHLIQITFIALLFFNCKEKTVSKPLKTASKTNVLTTAEKIANAHGYKNWNNVSEIAFTFADKRHWLWNTKTNTVSLFTETDTITYNRKQIDSINAKTDAAFTNDKFWLLFPFQLVWDKNVTISEAKNEIAPISQIELQKITLTYPNKGGYTPGDAYDIYFDNQYIIKEWVFRKQNQQEASLTNTFEDYKDFNGIKIAQSHKKVEGDWNLKLTNIAIK